MKTRPLTSNPVYFVISPSFHPITAFIIMGAPGRVKRSFGHHCPGVLVVFQLASEVGLDRLFERTFVLGGG